jgi:hypothetical protein
MTKSAWADPKLVIWLVTLIGVGAMAYQRLETLGESVADVQATIDEQGDGLAEHIASPDHTVRGIKVAALESDQAKIETNIEQIDIRQQKMERNQVRMCLAWGVECE